MKNSISQKIEALSQRISDKFNDHFFPQAKEEAKPFTEWYAEMKTMDDVADQLAEVYQHQANELKRFYNYNR
jgi:hypothetical protein